MGGRRRAAGPRCTGASASGWRRCSRRSCSDVAAELAYHFEAGAEWARAVTYLRLAADTAGRRYAYREAATTLQHALALVTHLPETPARTQHALTLHLALGAALLMTKGHAAPEVEHTYTQARALCQQMGATPELVPALFDLWRFYIARPQLQTARELGETLLGLAQPADDPALAVLAHYALGVRGSGLGPCLRPAGIWKQASPAPRQTSAVRRCPDGPRSGGGLPQFAAQTLWLLGYPAQALVRLHEALALAHALSHPYSLACVRCWAAVVAQFRRDVPAVHAHAEAAVDARDRAGLSPLGGHGRACVGGRWPCRARARRGWPRSARGSPPCRPPGPRCRSRTCAPCSQTSRPTSATRQTASRR